MSYTKKKPCSFAKPQAICEIEKRTVNVKDENGNVFTEVHYEEVDPSSPEYIESKNLPTADEYSLANLLAAGVPLEQIPTAHLLDPTNKATLEAHYGAQAVEVFNLLSSSTPKEEE